MIRSLMGHLISYLGLAQRQAKLSDASSVICHLSDFSSTQMHISSNVSSVIFLKFGPKMFASPRFELGPIQSWSKHPHAICFKSKYKLNLRTSLHHTLYFSSLLHVALGHTLDFNLNEYIINE